MLQNTKWSHECIEIWSQISTERYNLLVLREDSNMHITIRIGRERVLVLLFLSFLPLWLPDWHLLTFLALQLDTCKTLFIHHCSLGEASNYFCFWQAKSVKFMMMCYGVQRHFQQYFSYIMAVTGVPGEPTDLPQVRQTLSYIDTNCTCSCQSNYYTFTSTVLWIELKYGSFDDKQY
jgi:hypothetical protein